MQPTAIKIAEVLTSHCIFSHFQINVYSEGECFGQPISNLTSCLCNETGYLPPYDSSKACWNGVLLFEVTRACGSESFHAKFQDDTIDIFSALDDLFKYRLVIVIQAGSMILLVPKLTRILFLAMTICVVFAFSIRNSCLKRSIHSMVAFSLPAGRLKVQPLCFQGPRRRMVTRLRSQSVSIIKMLFCSD